MQKMKLFLFNSNSENIIFRFKTERKHSNKEVKNEESQNIEWKQSWHDDYLKWICGFANAVSDRIILGKETNIAFLRGIYGVFTG